MGYLYFLSLYTVTKKAWLKVVKLYPLHSQGSFVFVHSIRIISLKMSDSTKERFYFIQNKFIWNYFYTIGDYNKYLNTIRGLIGRCNRYFRWWLYFNPSGFRYDPQSPWYCKRYVWKKPVTQKNDRLFVVQPGLEPGLTGPESVVLPLHHWTISIKLVNSLVVSECKSTYFFKINKRYCNFFSLINFFLFLLVLILQVYTYINRGKSPT